jgi:hypothetical protein
LETRPRLLTDERRPDAGISVEIGVPRDVYAARAEIDSVRIEPWRAVELELIEKAAGTEQTQSRQRQ